MRVFLNGMTDTLAFVPGTVVLAAGYGTSALHIGLPPATVVMMSVIVVSGAAQPGALALWHGPALLVVFNSLTLSLRFLLMAGSTAAQLPPMDRGGWALPAFTLMDENYALFSVRRPEGRRWPYRVRRTDVARGREDGVQRFQAGQWSHQLLGRMGGTF